MRRAALLICVIAVLAAGVIYLTQDRGQHADTAGTIVRKEVVNGNQYWFHLEYTIDGYDGIFTASIKLRSRAEYGRYEIGDSYRFKRPLPGQ